MSVLLGSIFRTRDLQMNNSFQIIVLFDISSQCSRKNMWLHNFSFWNTGIRGNRWTAGIERIVGSPTRCFGDGLSHTRSQNNHLQRAGVCSIPTLECTLGCALTLVAEQSVIITKWTVPCSQIIAALSHHLGQEMYSYANKWIQRVPGELFCYGTVAKPFLFLSKSVVYEEGLWLVCNIWYKASDWQIFIGFMNHDPYLPIVTCMFHLWHMSEINHLRLMVDERLILSGVPNGKENRTYCLAMYHPRKYPSLARYDMHVHVLAASWWIKTKIVP